MTKILILYWSAYGHVEQMAKAVAEGARSVEGAEVTIKRVPELSSEEEAKRADRGLDQSVPVATVEELAGYDAIIFGTPTRFGNMAAPMRAFLDRTGGLWAADALVGKVGSVFTSSATQHGGQESTILSFHITLLHHGMVVVGLPYTCKAQTDARRDHRRLAVRRQHDRGRRRLAPAVRERARHGPFPGRARGAHRHEARRLARVGRFR